MSRSKHPQTLSGQDPIQDDFCHPITTPLHITKWVFISYPLFRMTLEPWSQLQLLGAGCCTNTSHNLGFLQYAQLFMTYMIRLIKLYTFWPLYILLQSNKTLTTYMNLLRAGSSFHTETFVWILWAYEKCQLATIKIGHLGCNSASRNTSSTKSHAHHDAKRCNDCSREKSAYLKSDPFRQKGWRKAVSESAQRKPAEAHSGLMYFVQQCNNGKGKLGPKPLCP